MFLNVSCYSELILHPILHTQFNKGLQQRKEPQEERSKIKSQERPITMKRIGNRI